MLAKRQEPTDNSEHRLPESNIVHHAFRMAKKSAMLPKWVQLLMQRSPKARRSVANSLIFLMPPGTDPEAVFAAVRATAATHFSDHRYILAQHRDTDHPHVHLVYALRNIHGTRTFLSHDDKQLMRESFAENLRVLGVDANATVRKARGLDDRQRPRGGVHRAREGREPSPAPASDSPGAAERRERRATRLRDFVRNVFDRAITELRQRSDPEGAAIAASLARFTGAMVPPEQAGQGWPTVVELGGKRIDVSALVPATRTEVLAMAVQAAERDERELTVPRTPWFSRT